MTLICFVKGFTKASECGSRQREDRWENRSNWTV